MPRTILLASPREPSGGSWIVNCLLELGVRVNMKPTVARAWRGGADSPEAATMWQATSSGRWRIHPRAEALTKWLPILSRRETLAFRDDVEVLYVQDLPDPGVHGDRTALFLRDPRDAIHSHYRRNRPEMPIEEFIRFPHHETLLDVVAHWALFVECWLARSGDCVYRFEDYKANDNALLGRIVGDLGIEASPEEIASAARESNYEKAREAEEKYRATHPQDDEIAMRAGKVGEWMTSEDLRAMSREIERRTGPLLTKLGYDLQDKASTTPGLEGISQMHFLRAFKRFDLPETLNVRLAEADPMNCPDLSGLLHFASVVDTDLIQRARLEAHEARSLLDSLDEYVGSWRELAHVRVEAARTRFSDGADYHLARVRELLASRRSQPRKTTTE